MRMRKIVLYFGLLAIIIGGAPYFTGYLVETKFQDVVHVLSDVDSVAIEIVKYERGWRKSFAQTRVNFSGEYPQALIDLTPGLTPEQKASLKQSGFSVTFDYDIRHGPFVQMRDGDWKDWRFALAAFHSQILLSDQTKDMLEKLIGQTKLLDINGEMSIEGAVKVDFQGVPLKLNEGKVESFVWKGMHGNWNLSRDMKHFKTEMVFPGASVQIGAKNFAAEDILARYDLQKSVDGLWLGKVSSTVHSLSLLDAQNPAENLALSAMTLGTVSDSESGLVEGSGNLTISVIKIGERDFGPFNLVFSVKNIDAVFLKSVVDFSRKMQAPNNQTNEAMTQEIMAKLPDLLKHRPIFSIDNMSMVTPDGELKAFFNLAFGGPQANNMGNTAQIIQSIAAKASAIIPKPILAELLAEQNMQVAETATPGAATTEDPKQKAATKAQESITKMLNEGWVIEKDNMYVSEWEFSEGQLKVNGKAMAMPQQAPATLPPSGAGAMPVPGSGSMIQ